MDVAIRSATDDDVPAPEEALVEHPGHGLLNGRVQPVALLSFDAAIDPYNAPRSMVVNGCPLTHTPHGRGDAERGAGRHPHRIHHIAMLLRAHVICGQPELTSQSQSEALRHGNGNYVFATALSHNRSDILD